ncbi:MAG: MarR family winged helix-turn-helix transcriptional regulator [Arenimonas sp.]
MDANDRIEFGYAVTDITRLLRRVFDRRSLHLGLTRAQWRAMYRITRVPGLSQTQLAEDLDLEAIAVGRVIDRLERAGFVERRADPEDRRRWNLHPLPRSGEVMGAMRRVAAALHEDLLTGVSGPDLETTMRVLERVKDTLSVLDQAGREPARPMRRPRKAP